MVDPVQYDAIGRKIVDLLVQGADENLPPNLIISLRDHRRSIAIFRGDQEVMRFVSPRTLGRTQ